eukprot:GSA25T00001311001.1
MIQNALDAVVSPARSSSRASLPGAGAPSPAPGNLSETRQQGQPKAAPVVSNLAAHSGGMFLTS